MNLLYGAICLFGLFGLILLIKDRQLFKKNRQVISPAKMALLTDAEPVVEYEMLLEHSSRLIAILGRFEKSLQIKGVCALLSTLIFFLFSLTALLDGQTLLLLWISTVAVIILVPGLLRQALINQKTKTILNDLPMFIDLVAVCVQSGMTVEASLSHATKNFSRINNSMVVVMSRVMRRTELHGLNNALKDLYHSLPALEIRMFSTSLQQSAHFGASVYDQLVNLSKDIREAQLLATEEKIGKLAAKIGLPLILLILFPILVLLTAPRVMYTMQYLPF